MKMIDVSSRWTHMWKSSKEVDRWRWIMDILCLDVSYVVSSMSQLFLQVTSDTFWSSQKAVLSGGPKHGQEWPGEIGFFKFMFCFLLLILTKRSKGAEKTCRERSVDSTSLWQFLSLDTCKTQTKYFLCLFRAGAFDLNKDDFVILRRSCGSVQAPDAQNLFRSQRKAGWIVDLKGYRQGDKRLFFSVLRFCRCKIYLKKMSGMCVCVSCLHDVCWKMMF